MATYRVRENMTFGTHGQHGPGDTVQLDEHEAGPFLDKLEAVSDTSPGDDETAPATQDAPPVVLSNDDAADDLTAITGIGDSTEETLNYLDVHTYADLLAIIDESPHLLRDNIRGITADKVDTWREEAAALLEAE